MADKENVWRFIDTGINDGFMNMAIDEAMLEMHLQGQIPPTFRIYRWSPQALSMEDLHKDFISPSDQKISIGGLNKCRKLTKMSLS